MIQKKKLLETINNLPEEFSIDELVERLIIIQKVESAQKQSKEGKKFSESEARAKIRKWSQ
jgi:hypothetical protein